MLKYTKQQLQNRKLRQAIGFTVVIAVIVAALIVTIAVVSDNEPEVNNRIESNTESR